MGCNVLFLLYYNRYKERFKNDDRYKPWMTWKSHYTEKNVHY
jgi:hypothetical protein